MALGRFGRLAAAPTRGYRCINIRYLLMKAIKKRLPVLFHFFGRVTSYCLFITPHLIHETGTKPL